MAGSKSVRSNLGAGALALVLALSACAQTAVVETQSEPSAAFLELEQRLRAARHVSFSVGVVETTASEEESTTLEARFVFGPENRMRVESTGEVNGLFATPSVVSDGAVMTGGRNGFHVDFVDFKDHMVPPDLRDDVLGSILRWGALPQLLSLVRGVPPGYNTVGAGPDDDLPAGDPAARVGIRDAAWGQPETFNGVTVRPLSFTLTHPFGFEAEATLWLSAETGLPVRQIVRLASDEPRIVEGQYSRWSFEEPPEATFELPE